MFVAPQFGRYAPELGRLLTCWLYGDALANELYWDKPDDWPGSGGVKIVDVTHTFTDLVDSSPGGLDSEDAQDLDLQRLFGGGNAVLLSRSAEVVLTDPPDPVNVVQLPNQLAGYALCRQFDDDWVQIGDTAICNAFGSRAQPFIFPFPELWVGGVDRTFRVASIFTDLHLNVTVSWKIAVFDGGR